MSSHHFVREGQEPALLIEGPVEFSLAAPLLEWAPMVIVTPHSLEAVLDWNIKIDVVITTPGSADILKETLLSQAPIKILTTEAGDSLETALYFLIASKQQAVSILMEDPMSGITRVDSFMDRLNINILSESGKWSGFHSGVFKKWLPAGSKLAFHASDEILFHKNLRRSGSELEVIEDGIVELSHPTPFWVQEMI